MHPRICGGVLAVRSNPDHMAALAEHGIEPIDMIVVNLYAFEKTAANPDASFRSEDREHRHRRPYHDPFRREKLPRPSPWSPRSTDYGALLAEMDENDGGLSEATHWRLAQGAFQTTAAYDRAISSTLAQLSPEGSSSEGDPFPATLDILLPKAQTLRYGENPHQQAALYSARTEGVAGAKQLHGKELSYNNLVDLDACWALIQELDDPACAIIKHTNPCGCAEQATLAEAYRKALECDPVSAFGSVISVNRLVDAETAEEMAKLFVRSDRGAGLRAGRAGRADSQEEHSPARDRGDPAGARPQEHLRRLPRPNRRPP